MVHADVVVPDIDADSPFGVLFKGKAGKVIVLASLLDRKSLDVLRTMRSLMNGMDC